VSQDTLPLSSGESVMRINVMLIEHFIFKDVIGAHESREEFEMVYARI
jgi:hypothetical protein